MHKPWIVLGFLLLSGCGQSSTSNSASPLGTSTTCSDNPFLGTYTGTILGNLDVMEVKSDCTITSTYCVSTATYQDVSNSSGSVTVNVTSTGGEAGCLPLGETTCGYLISGSQLEFNCGGSTLVYTKQ